jgi:hypothetical protein
MGSDDDADVDQMLGSGRLRDRPRSGDRRGQVELNAFGQRRSVDVLEFAADDDVPVPLLAMLVFVKPIVWAELASLFAWASVIRGLLPVAPEM